MIHYSIPFNRKRHFFNINNLEWKTLIATIEENLPKHPFLISNDEDNIIFHIENLNIDIILELDRLINDCQEAKTELIPMIANHIKLLSSIFTNHEHIPDILAYHYKENSDKETPFEGLDHLKWQLHKQTI